MAMRFAARTHPGRRSGQNEDSIGWDESQCVWFVADGMGGHASGDVASRIVKETLLEAAASPLEAAVQKAHEAVVTAAANTPAYNNMGSTVVALRVAERRAQVVWVGDSRAYLWRDRGLRPLSRDHSFLEMLREQGSLTDSEMRGHPNKNLVTQTLGISKPQPSVINVPLRTDDWLLLCSDGLNDELDDNEIAKLLRTCSAPEAAAETLISAALAKGGKDNVSVVIVEYDGPNGVSFLGKFRYKSVLWIPVASGVFAAIGFAALWWWFKVGR
jgi:PPM family protein phosphatase